MATWMKMTVTVAVALMPGGFLFLFCWVLWRAWANQWRVAQAAAGERPNAFRLLGQIHLRDLWREARAMSGWPSAGTHHPASM